MRRGWNRAALIAVARRLFDAIERAVLQALASGPGDFVTARARFYLAASVRAVRLISSTGDCGMFERGESYGRVGWTRHRLRAGFGGGADGADLSFQQREVRRLPGHPEDSRCRGARDLLRFAGWSFAGFSLVQRAPGGNVYGRRGLARP